MTKLYFTVFLSELLAITIARPLNDNFDFFGGLDSTFDPFEDSGFGDFPSSDGSLPEYYDSSSSLDPFNDLVFGENPFNLDNPFKNFLPLAPAGSDAGSSFDPIKDLVYGPEFLFGPNFKIGSKNPFGPNFPFATDDSFYVNPTSDYSSDSYSDNGDYFVNKFASYFGVDSGQSNQNTDFSLPSSEDSFGIDPEDLFGSTNIFVVKPSDVQGRVLFDPNSFRAFLKISGRSYAMM